MYQFLFKFSFQNELGSIENIRKSPHENKFRIKDVYKILTAST